MRSSILKALTPPSLRGYQRAYLWPDIIAGLTLAAVAIPEVMGYTSIARTPLAHRVFCQAGGNALAGFRLYACASGLERRT